jgi:type II secretory pathway pseudopilin PulG
VTQSPKCQYRKRQSERGFSLVESVIGLLVLTIVLVVGFRLFSVQVEHIALAQRARRADVKANELMNTLAAFNLSALPDGNPFNDKGPSDNINPGEAVSLNSNACLAQANCDQISRSPQATGTASTYTTVGWNQPKPSNGTIIYYRAWRVTTLDAAKGLRRITLVILPAEPDKNPATDRIEPLALRKTDVVQRQ